MTDTPSPAPAEAEGLSGPCKHCGEYFPPVCPVCAEELRAQTAPDDPLANLVEKFSRRLLAKLRLAQANGKSGWERDDWEAACQQGLLRHIEKGDPRDVAAYCAFMDHHGWITKSAPAPFSAPQVGVREALERLLAWADDSNYSSEVIGIAFRARADFFRAALQPSSGSGE